MIRTIWYALVALTLIACSGGSENGGLAPGTSTPETGQPSGPGMGMGDPSGQGPMTGTGGATAVNDGGAGPGGAGPSEAGNGGMTPAPGGAGGLGGEGVPQGLIAVAARAGVGLEWSPVAGAESYNLYWSTEPGVTPATGMPITGVQRNHIHEDLTDGTTYYYVVTAVAGGQESPPSAPAMATPGGEYELRFFGNGDALTIAGAGNIHVAIEDRIHALILGDGYLADELDDYDNDVDGYIEDIFELELYQQLRESLVIWALPRASAGHLGGDTAWGLTGSPSAGDETAGRVWEAVLGMPFEPKRYDNGDIRNVVVGLMAYDAGRGRSGYSGFQRSVRHPDTGDRLEVAFFHDRAHEFTHAIGNVSDEYYDTGHGGATTSRETSNIWGERDCNTLPWRHLLLGGDFNPGVDELVGAFGAPERVHPEFKCKMNGSHDNDDLFGGRANLRVDRFCNWCRELVTFWVYERQGVLDEDSGWDTWESDYRSGFWDAFEFKVPDEVPQTNSLGDPWFQPCEG